MRASNSRGSQSNDEKLLVAAALLGAGMLHIHLTMKRHIDDCSAKSALVAKILIGVAVMVLGELIIRGISLFKLAGAVTGGN